MQSLSFIVPGSIDQLTGGYIFDKRLVDGLRFQGWRVDVIELPGRFPLADEVALEAAERALASMADQTLAVIDGLALPAFLGAISRHAQRLRLIGFIHHPLSLETGLDDGSRAQLAAIEARLWPMLRGIVCPSENSARAVVSAGVRRGRIEVTPPGTDPIIARVRRRDRSDQTGPLRLLTVGTVTVRKGHCLLIEALAALPAELNWTLDCMGSLTRDCAEVTRLRALIERFGLQSRVKLHGEVALPVLEAAYDQADLFVLPSWHEGYGMVFAEAMARGLPVISTTGGAIPELVPDSAGLLVSPGDRPGLTAALHTLIGDSDLRERLSNGARETSRSLPDWPAATTRWIDAVTRRAA